MRRLTTAPNIAIATLWADMLTSGGIRSTVQRYFASSIAGEIPPDQALPEIWIEDAAQYDAATLDKVLNDVENDVLCMALASCDAETVAVFVKALTEQRRELVEQQITNSKAMPKEALASARQLLTNKFREFLV